MNENIHGVNATRIASELFLIAGGEASHLVAEGSRQGQGATSGRTVALEGGVGVAVQLLRRVNRW